MAVPGCHMIWTKLNGIGIEILALKKDSGSVCLKKVP